MFWIPFENHVGGTVVFWLFLINAYPVSRNFSVLCSASKLCTKAGGAWPGELTWPGRRDIPYTDPHGQQINIGNYLKRGQSGTGDRVWCLSAGGEQFIVHHLFSSWVPSHFIFIIVIFCSFSVILTYKFYFWFSFPLTQWGAGVWRVSEWLCGA